MTAGAVSAVGFVPAAPLLVPQVAAGSAHLDADLRDASREVVRRLTATADGSITIAAPATTQSPWDLEATWGFEGFGVPRQPADPRPRLPWPLGIGDWLLDDLGWSGRRHYLAVTTDGVATSDVTTGTLLVVGDGSSRRTEKAPGHLDDRATAFDAGIANAISTGDVKALGGLDPALAAELMCSGAPVWRWVCELLAGRAVEEAELLADTAPYGVGYFAGWWRVS